MRFGFLISKQYPAGDSARQRFLDHMEQVRLARDLGFDTIVIGQHFLSSPFQEPQSVPLLARLAAEAGTMRLGLSIVLLALLPPVEMAEIGATLDVITGGRFIFGFGIGYRETEYNALGVPVRERVRRFEDNFGIITRLWAGERVSYEGPHCRLEDASLTLRPIQQPHPPLWMAANADSAVRRAARLADTWVINPHTKIAAIKRQLELYRDELAAHGKPFPDDVPLRRELYIGPQRATARSEAQPFMDTKYNAYRQWGQHTVLPADDGWSSEFAELARDRFIIGDPMAVRDELQRYQEELRGVNHFLFRVQYPGMPQELVLRTMRLLGEQVLPHVKPLPAR